MSSYAIDDNLVLWIESRRAVVAGDALVDFGRGFEIPPEVLRHGATREQVTEGLRPLLALRSSSCSRRTEHRQTVLRSSARSPDA